MAQRNLINLRRLALPLIKVIHPDALSHKLGGGNGTLRAAVEEAASTNAANLRILNSLIDTCEERASDGRSPPPLPSYKLSFFVPKNENGNKEIFVRCDTSLEFPRQVVEAGGLGGFRRHAENQICRLLMDCGMEGDVSVNVKEARRQEEQLDEGVTSRKFKKSARECRNDSMTLEEYEAIFKESVQKATSGFSIPSQNELYGARGNRTWRNTTEFEWKRAPPLVSDHYDPVHWRAWKMLRKDRLLFHNDISLPLQAVVTQRLADIISRHYEEWVLGNEDLWKDTILVATGEDTKGYRLLPNSASGGRTDVLAFPALFCESDLANLLSTFAAGASSSAKARGNHHNKTQSIYNFIIQASERCEGGG